MRYLIIRLELFWETNLVQLLYKIQDTPHRFDLQGEEAIIPEPLVVNEVTFQIDGERTGLLVQIEQTRPAWSVLVTLSDGFSYTAYNAQVQGDQLALTGRNVELRWE